MENELNEECGVLGYYDFDGADTARLLHAGLYALQHRGLQSCGIVTNDDARLHQIKDNGTAAEVFNEKNLDSLTGTIGVAHVRYAPGGDIPENAQPLVSRYCKGSITLAHNGNIINARELREELEAGGAIFQSTNDTEVILHLIAIARTRTPSVEQAMLRVMERIEGAYSMVLMSPRKLMAIRDPQGFRPLCIGRRRHVGHHAGDPLLCRHRSGRRYRGRADGGFFRNGYPAAAADAEEWRRSPPRAGIGHGKIISESKNYN